MQYAHEFWPRFANAKLARLSRSTRFSTAAGSKSSTLDRVSASAMCVSVSLANTTGCTL